MIDMRHISAVNKIINFNKDISIKTTEEEYLFMLVYFHKYIDDYDIDKIEDFILYGINNYLDGLMFDIICFISHHNLDFDIMYMIHQYLVKYPYMQLKHLLNNLFEDCPTIKCDSLTLMNDSWDERLDYNVVFNAILHIQDLDIHTLVDFLEKHKDTNFEKVNIKKLLIFFGFENKQLTEREQLVLYEYFYFDSKDIWQCHNILDIFNKIINTSGKQIFYLGDLYSHTITELKAMYNEFFIFEETKQRINKVIQTKYITQKLEESI